MPIYKYLAAERYDVLRDARVRFTQPNALNDPFELKPFFKTLFNENTFRQNIRSRMDLRSALLEKYSLMPRDLRRRLSAEQFTQIALKEMESRKEEFESTFEEIMHGFISMMPAMASKFLSIMHGQFGNSIGILSLSEDPASDLMWAHYANDHAGFVIEFDETNEFFNRRRSEKDEFFYLRPVTYVGKRLSFDSLEQMIDSQSDLFASKLDSWAYEKEWRMLVPLLDRTPDIDAAEPIHLFSFPRIAVRSVIFGCRSSTNLRNQVCSILDQDAAYAHVQKFVAYVDLENGRISTRPHP